VIADKNLNVVAGEIIVDPGNDLLKRQERFEQKKSGLTLSVSSPVIDAAMAANNTLKRSQEISDERLKTLYAVQAAKNAWVAVSQAPSMAADIAQGNMNAVKVEVSVGSSKHFVRVQFYTKSGSWQYAQCRRKYNAGGDGSERSSGDLHVSGSGVTGKNVTLVAQNNLVLDAASDNSEQTSKNSSSGWNVGVHVSLGQETVSVSQPVVTNRRERLTVRAQSMSIPALAPVTS
jgi:filamentous hemagglutinin